MPITEWVRRDRLPQASPLSLRRRLRAATQPGSADGCGVLSTTVPFSASVLVPTAASAPRIRAQQRPPRRSSGGHAACGAAPRETAADLRRLPGAQLGAERSEAVGVWGKGEGRGGWTGGGGGGAAGALPADAVCRQGVLDASSKLMLALYSELSRGRRGRGRGRGRGRKERERERERLPSPACGATAPHIDSWGSVVHPGS